jgi:hypothetical protein
MRPHENLEVWKKSIETALSVYKVTESFPKEEKFGLTSQLRELPFRLRQILRKVLPEPQRKSFVTFFRTPGISERS